MLAWLLVTENGFVLAGGLAIGAAAALVAVGPHLLAVGSQVPWTSLGLTLAGVLAAGLAASAAAVFIALRAELLPALKAE